MAEYEFKSNYYPESEYRSSLLIRDVEIWLLANNIATNADKIADAAEINSRNPLSKAISGLKDSASDFTERLEISLLMQKDAVGEILPKFKKPVQIGVAVMLMFSSIGSNLALNYPTLYVSSQVAEEKPKLLN